MVSGAELYGDQNEYIFKQVCDYRSCMLKFRNSNSSGDEFPRVQKVCLRMGMENVVKDMPSISDDSWTYNDLLVSLNDYSVFLVPLCYFNFSKLLVFICVSASGVSDCEGLATGALSGPRSIPGQAL